MDFMERANTRDYSKTWSLEGTFPWFNQQPKPPIDETNRPCSVLENYKRCVTGKEPYWMPAYGFEQQIVWPETIEEHPVPEVDGYDWWGVDWTMVEEVGGMITRPGTQVISDFANWKEDVPWPDISKVDFKSDGEKVQKIADFKRPRVYENVEGVFERLHEMLPFTESLLAFYEEPELLYEFFDKMVDYKIETTLKVFQFYGRIDGIQYHDDWGTQRAGFFSNEMFRKQLLPHEKRLIKFFKDQGKFVELHSCGKNIQYLPYMVEMGIDMWTPQWNANDPDWLFENWNRVMTFAFPCEIDANDTEEDVRKKVDDYVERYGGNGRWMCWIMAPMDKPELNAIASDELYNYSLAYYNKLYGRD